MLYEQFFFGWHRSLSIFLTAERVKNFRHLAFSTEGEISNRLKFHLADF